MGEVNGGGSGQSERMTRKKRELPHGSGPETDRQDRNQRAAKRLCETQNRFPLRVKRPGHVACHCSTNNILPILDSLRCFYALYTTWPVIASILSLLSRPFLLAVDTRYNARHSAQ